MMKNCFEVDGFIVPFDKVIASQQAHIDYGVYKMRCYYTSDEFVDVSFEEFARYKAWLDSQSNYSEILNSSEKANESKNLLTLMQVIAIRDLFELIDYKKDTILEEVHNNLKKMLGDTEGIYDIGSMLVSEKANDLEKFRNNPELVDVFNNLPINKANNSNHLPDVGKTMLTREQINRIGKEGWLPCFTCTQKGKIECKNCSAYITADDFIKEINKLINEEMK